MHWLFYRLSNVRYFPKLNIISVCNMKIIIKYIASCRNISCVGMATRSEWRIIYNNVRSSCKISNILI